MDVKLRQLIISSICDLFGENRLTWERFVCNCIVIENVHLINLYLTFIFIPHTVH